MTKTKAAPRPRPADPPSVLPGWVRRDDSLDWLTHEMDGRTEFDRMMTHAPGAFVEHILTRVGVAILTYETTERELTRVFRVIEKSHRRDGFADADNQALRLGRAVQLLGPIHEACATAQKLIDAYQQGWAAMYERGLICRPTPQPNRRRKS